MAGGVPRVKTDPRVEAFGAALAANPRAAAFFPTLNSANRFAILVRVRNSKRPETRARNIARFVTERFYAEPLGRPVPEGAAGLIPATRQGELV